jgi:hypothetical protein
MEDQGKAVLTRSGFFNRELSVLGTSMFKLDAIQMILFNNITFFFIKMFLFRFLSICVLIIKIANIKCRYMKNEKKLCKVNFALLQTLKACTGLYALYKNLVCKYFFLKSFNLH